MNVVLSVDALVAPLTGIGRYAFELASRLEQVPGVNELRFFDAGHWVSDRVGLFRRALTLSDGTERSLSVRHRSAWPRWVRHRLAPTYWKLVLNGRVFHGPNYFLPPQVDKGVITVHDLSIYRYPHLHPAARLKQFDLHFERSLRMARHLITDSHAVRAEVMAHFGWPSERITAVALGVSESYAPRTSGETSAVMHRYGLAHEGYVLCVSTLEPRKNIDKLLMAYAQLPERLRTSYPLVLIGAAGWENSVLRTQIERASRAGWLIHPGYVPEAELPYIYAGARLFAFPSIYEGFGLPLLEAMASGVPVLTSNRSSLAEVGGDAARLVDPDDIEAMRDYIASGLDDPQWHASARERGLARARAFTWQRCAEATVAVYGNMDAH